MYAITEGVTKVRGREVHSFRRDVDVGKELLSVKAGTTGYKGDVGCAEDSRTFISLESILGNVRFAPITDAQDYLTGFQLVGCGDDALHALVRAMKFIVKVLDEQRLGIGE